MTDAGQNGDPVSFQFDSAAPTIPPTAPVQIRLEFGRI
ncbi:hypothetical protein PICSAR253_04565 [Mycobacterium avium subsp. paratuberculosis]|nr:hypothetical protein PICSAR253_04565 [Mycobacterium avium subsp. paratuberculosis]